jgi:chromosome segregation ATPase
MFLVLVIDYKTNIEKRIDDLNQSMLSVSSRVRTLENRSNELTAKITECESSCQGVSNLFDQVEKQCKTNTRNIIHFDSRIKKLDNPVKIKLFFIERHLRASTLSFNDLISSDSTTG